MTPARSFMVASLRFLAYGSFPIGTRALVPILGSPHSCRSFRQPSSSASADETIRFSPYPDAKETLLVVGDGDLSYSSSIASETAASGASLIASVLETQEEHQEIYRNSEHHVQKIVSHSPHQVLFGTDATKLHKSFPSDSFDRIQFNFPHWRGKSNNRYNRQLLSEFLHSASQVLKKNGEIQVALRTEQGGSHAQDLIAWRGSWKASELAADAGLLLSRLEPFKPNYDVSSYRGRDKLFHVGKNPERYVFTFPPNPTPIEQRLQLCYRHELRLMMDPDCLQASPYTEDELLNSDMILTMARQLAPEGVSVDIPAKAKVIPEPDKKRPSCELLVFLLLYGGERRPLTRLDADQIRAHLEDTAASELQFPIAKKGRMVSKPFPFTALEHLLEKHS